MHNQNSFPESDSVDSGSENGKLSTFDSNEYQVASLQIDKSISQSVESQILPPLTIASDNQINALFQSTDTSNDGILSLDEINAGLKSKALSGKDRELLSGMKESFDVLQNLSSNEAGNELGITTVDINEHHKRGLDSTHIKALRPGAEALRLKEVAKQNLSPEEFKFLEENMEKFESRKDNSPGDIADTYKQLNRMFESRDNAKIPAHAMDNLALDVIYHAANPKTVNQGDAFTCTVASLESRMYQRHPAQAARLVADASIQGFYNPTDGSDSVVIDTSSFNNYPGMERASGLDSTYDGNERTHANQIFQITATNLHYEKTKSGTQRDYDYRASTSEDGNYSEGRHDLETGNTTSATGILVYDGAALETLNNAISGVEEGSFVIDASNARSQEEFNEKMEQLKESGNEPALVIVSNGHPEISDSPYGGLGFHVFTVESDGTENDLLINDQYGNNRDRNATREDLFKFIKVPHFDRLQKSDVDLVVDSLIELSNKDTLDAEAQEKLRMSINVMTPETFAVFDEAYKAKTGTTIRDSLAKFLSWSDLNHLDADYESSFPPKPKDR